MRRTESLEERRLLTLDVSTSGPYAISEGDLLDLSASVVGSDFHNPLTVIAIGDSQTNGYATTRLQNALDAADLPMVAYKLSSGGMTAQVLTGQAIDIYADPPAAHDFGAEAIAMHPDVILFMLGISDALYISDGFSQYAALVGSEFDAFDAAKIPVVIGSCLPVLNNPSNPNYALADERLRTEYNPWLEQQAQERGYVYLDNYDAIQQIPNWQQWYSDDGINPGYVHLWGGLSNGSAPGYDWLASTFVAGIEQAITQWPDPVSFDWDINGDGVFGDASGPNPQLTWSRLEALGITDGPSTTDVTLRVTDLADGETAVAETTLTVNDAPPRISLSGPSTAVPGQPRTYSITATDPSPADQAAGFTFTINWGDGSPLQTVNGPSGTQVSHTFNDVGNLPVTVTAADRDGLTSDPVSLTIGASAVQLLPDQQNPALTDLVWNGTMAADSVAFQQMDATTIRVVTLEENGFQVNATETFTGVTGRVVANGNAGDDTLDATGLTTIQATLIGGPGNNLISAGNANNIIYGTAAGKQPAGDIAGNNTIVVGDGNNVIYGNYSGNGGEGSSGNNSITVGNGNNTIYGNFGGNGGEGGDNFINAGNGQNLIYGNAGGSGDTGGNNTIAVGNGGNIIYGNFGGVGNRGGNNLIIGGAGNDRIYGNFGATLDNGAEGGQNIIVAGGGADTIYVSQQSNGAEGGRGSILIAGTTSLGQAALAAVMSEWTSNEDLSTRIRRIEGVLPSGANGNNYLQPGVTVFNDQAATHIYGDLLGAIDWFWYTQGQDSISRTKPTDIVTNLPAF